MMDHLSYPIHFSVDYPDRPLDRLTTLFRILWVIPILIVLGAVAGGAGGWSPDRDTAGDAGAGGMLFFGPLLMILFCRAYPRWWFDWDLELQRFANRVVAYLALMGDHYPSVEEHQAIHLEYPYPDVVRDLNRWLPLVKWFLAIPHYLVLAVLNLAAAGAVFGAWVAILVTGRYPRRLFGFVEGVLRWDNRVIAYAFTLVTDRYPPFRLAP